MKTADVMKLAGLAVAGYLLYQLVHKGSEVVDTVSSSIANLWLKMFPLPPAMELLGNVKFPGNILVPLQQLASAGVVKQDTNGDVFVKYSNMYWKLSPQVYGNWPATRVG